MDEQLVQKILNLLGGVRKSKGKARDKILRIKHPADRSKPKKPISGFVWYTEETTRIAHKYDNNLGQILLCGTTSGNIQRN